MTSSLVVGVVMFLGASSSGATSVPASVVIATSRGEHVVPVALHEGHPSLSVPALSRYLPITDRIEGDWAVVAFGGEPFRFLLEAPVLMHGPRMIPLVGGAYLVRDTLYVPLQWLAELVPQVFTEGYRYDPRSARFEEAGLPRLANASAATRAAFEPASARGREAGLRMAHRVVIDPGHGGVDPGNPGRYLPRGVKEKHVTLSIGQLLRTELERRGVDVVMTRSTDTLINLEHRARFCRDGCDLFVSVHVNSMPRRTGYERVSGFETYFLGEALTAEAQRVAQMENEALRYETGSAIGANDALTFIFKDLQTNEILRESALLADVVQTHGASVHPGGDRGISQNRFVVLATATRPAILVETGFATNRRDGEFLASTSGQRRLAQAMANGIVVYLKRYEQKVLIGMEP